MKNNEESVKNTGEFAIHRYSPLKFATVGPGHYTCSLVSLLHKLTGCPQLLFHISLSKLGLRTSTRALVYEAVLQVHFRNSVTREVLYYRPRNQTLV